MLAHIVEGLIEHQRVRTTINRAKEARFLAERLITISKQNTLHARRQVISALYSEPLAKKMFEKVAPAFSLVKGGYTRIIRAENRPGDGAQMVYLEFSKPIDLVEPKPRGKKDKSKTKNQTAKKKWDDVTVVKKDSLEEDKTKKEKKPKKEGAKDSEIEKPEEEKKKGGFLGTLRKFLKGEK